MNLSTLPQHILVDIFGRIDWINLINIRLTCKRFELIIKSKSHRMKKPELCFLDVDFLQAKNGKTIRIQYKICSETNQHICNHYSRNNRKSVSYTNLEDYENFLKKWFYKKLVHLFFSIESCTSIIKLFNKYYTPGIKLKKVLIEDHCGLIAKNVNDILNFISMIKDTEFMGLTLSFGDQEIPENFTFPAMKSLRKFYLEEKEGTNFITPKMISNLVHNSGDKCRFNLLSRNQNIYKDIVENCLSNTSFNNNSKCSCRSYNIAFYNSSILESIDIFFLKNIFKTNDYELFYNTGSDDNQFFFGYKTCLKCESHCYSSFYSRPMSHYYQDSWDILFS